MASSKRLPQPEHTQSTVEWRFARAHRYWDDCGKLIAAIEVEFPGLHCQALEENGFKFSGRSRGISAAMFYWDKASVSQGDIGDAGLPNATEGYWPLVQQWLGVDAPIRIGHRTWMRFETNTVKDAARWLEGLALWRGGEWGANDLGTPQSAGVVLRTRIEPVGRRMRLEVNAGTVTVNGRERHGVLVDVDLVVEAPDVMPTGAAEFIRWNLEFLRDRVIPVFRGR